MENKDKLESFLNEVFSSNEFMSALLESTADNFNYIDITIKIYNVLNYYLLTRNLTYNYDFLFNIMKDVDINNAFLDQKLIFDGLKQKNKNLKDDQLAQKLIQNYYTNGFVAHSCNPIYLKDIIEYGLGNKTIQNEAEQELNYLEQFIYKDKFLSRQKNSNYYYSFPSANNIHYAIGMSPEKVFGGPLKILNKTGSLDDNTLFKYVPYIYKNQSIKKFYKKIAKNNIKIAILKNKELKKLKQSLKNKYKKLINDFCFKYAIILLIPINKCQIMAYNKSIETSKEQTLDYYIKNLSCGNGVDLFKPQTFEETYNLIKTITPKAVGQNDNTYMANLCSNKIIKNTNDILKIKIPVFFEITKLYLKKKHIFRTKIKINPYIND